MNTLVGTIHGRVCPSERGGYEYDLFWFDDVLTSRCAYPTQHLAEQAMERALRECQARLLLVPDQEALIRQACGSAGVCLCRHGTFWELESPNTGNSQMLWVNPLRPLGWQSSSSELEQVLQEFFGVLVPQGEGYDGHIG